MTNLAKYQPTYFVQTRKLALVLQNAIENLSQNPTDTQSLEDCLHASHTLKGSSSSMKCKNLSDFSQFLENLFTRYSQGKGISPNIYKKIVNNLSNIIQAENFDDLKKLKF